MNNYKNNLENLNFHDSSIISIKLSDDDNNNRKISLLIHYYNWEENSKKNDWKYKILRLNFKNMVHFQYNAPNLVKHSFEILDVEYNPEFNEFLVKAEKDKKALNIHAIKSLKLDNFLSIKYLTTNFDNSLFNDLAGYIWIAGFNVQHEWVEDNLIGKKLISCLHKNSSI